MFKHPAFITILPERPQEPFTKAQEPHWLLEHPYGWAFLASELRRIRPELHCPRYTPCPEFFPQMENLIDQLGLRDWQSPTGWRAQYRATKLIFRMFWCLNMGREVPAWNDATMNGGGCV